MKFWTQVQDTWFTLYKSPLATVAAINGTSPAGGCLLSLGCDYRIMADHKKFQIGLNETKLGLVAPQWFAKPFQALIGEREAEKALYLGTLYPVDEAVKIGLVDEKCKVDEDILEIAVNRLEDFLEVPCFARIGTKQEITRKDTIDWFQANRENDMKEFKKSVLNENVQKALGGYVETLKKRSKK